MGKWVVTGTIYFPDQNRYYQPGEIITLDDVGARILLNKQVIKPAEYKREIKMQKEYEVKDGSNH
jgi:hypothetical protein